MLFIYYIYTYSREINIQSKCFLFKCTRNITEGENYNALNSKQYPERTYDSPNRRRKQTKSNNHATLAKLTCLVNVELVTRYTNCCAIRSRKKTENHAVFKDRTIFLSKETLRALIDSHAFQSVNPKSCTKTNKAKKSLHVQKYTIFLVHVHFTQRYAQSTQFVHEREPKSRRILGKSIEISIY